MLSLLLAALLKNTPASPTLINTNSPHQRANDRSLNKTAPLTSQKP